MSEIEQSLLAKFDTYYGRWEDQFKNWYEIKEDLLGRYKLSKNEVDIIIDSLEEEERFLSLDDPNTPENEGIVRPIKNLANFFIVENIIDNDKPIIDVEGITLSKSSISINKGASTTLLATLFPSNATNKVITWESEDPTVAAVSFKNNGSSCTVLGKGEGDTKIMATTANGISAECEVSVIIPVINVSKVTLSKTSLNIERGGIYTLTAIVAPTNATDKTITWESSNPDVAIVTDGTVTGVTEGSCIITATSVNGKSGSCNVIVSEPVIAVESISIDKEEITFDKGLTYELHASILPENATNTHVTWTSSKPSVATVTFNGDGHICTVTGKSQGNCTITARSNNGKTATCEVNITLPIVEVSSVSLNKHNLSLNTGDTTTLSATVLPANATNKSLIWESSDSTKATVVNGLVTAVAPGDVVISARSNNGKTDSCSIIISEPIIEVSSVTLNKSSLTLEIGDSETLIAAVIPDNATDKSIIWESSDDAKATVVNGLVTAVTPGDVVISVRSNNGKTSSCSLHINEPYIAVQEIVLSETNKSIEVNEQFTLSAEVLPTNATNKTLTWTANNENISISNGVVTGVSEGNTIITVSSVDGVEVSCMVEVRPEYIPVTDVYLGCIALDDEGNPLSEEPSFDDILDASIGSRYILTAAIAPETSTDDSMTWEVISGEDYIDIFDIGEGSCRGIEALAEGTSIIKVTAANGVSDTFSITILPEEIEEEPEPVDDGYLTFAEGSWIGCASNGIDPPTVDNWDPSTNTLTITFTAKSQKILNTGVVNSKYYVKFDSIEYLNSDSEPVSIAGTTASDYIGFYEGGTSSGGTGKYSIKSGVIYIGSDVIEPYNNERLLQFNTSSKYTVANGGVLPITLVIHGLKYRIYEGALNGGQAVPEDELNPPVIDPSTGDDGGDPSTGGGEDVDPNTILGHIGLDDSNSIIIDDASLTSGTYALAYCDNNGEVIGDNEWHPIYSFEKE